MQLINKTLVQKQKTRAAAQRRLQAIVKAGSSKNATVLESAQRALDRADAARSRAINTASELAGRGSGIHSLVTLQ